MQDLPHHYSVVATGEPAGDVALEGNRLPTLHSSSPAEFGGPGDRWSPETFLVGAIADCFVLTLGPLDRAAMRGEGHARSSRPGKGVHARRHPRASARAARNGR